MTKPPTPSPEEVGLGAVEKRLRGAAPALPCALRSRTLDTCARRAAEQARRQNRLHWRLTFAVAGVLALQWTTLCLVDAQNTRLIAGDSPPRLFASLSLSQINQLWHQRSRQIAQLMKPSPIG